MMGAALAVPCAIGMATTGVATTGMTATADGMASARGATDMAQRMRTFQFTTQIGEGTSAALPHGYHN